MNKLKVAYLSSSYIPSKSANLVHVVNMTGAMKTLNLEVEVHAAKSGDAGNEQTGFVLERLKGFVTHFRLKMPVVGSIAYGLSVGMSLRNRYFNIHYGRCPHSLLASMYLGNADKWYFEAHDLPKGLLRRIAERMILKSPKLSKLVVISNELKNDYQKLFPFLDENKIIVAHDAANLPKVTSFKKEESYSTKSFRIVYAGSLYPGKGFEVIKELAQRMSDCNFIVVGDVEPLSVEERTNQPTNLKLVGYIPHQEVSDYLSNADVLLLPNQEKVQVEGGGDIGKYTSPLKLFEYMAHQKPIVASSLPNLREVLIDKENALLVESDNIDSWVSAIESLRGNGSLRKKLALNAIRKFEREYTWEKRVKRIFSDELILTPLK